MHMKVLNVKSDLSNFGGNSLRENEVWLGSTSMKAGLFTDNGYRFRENVFEKTDNYIPFLGKHLESFYDIVFFSNDQLSVGDDFMTIAKIYFRIDINMIEHERIVYRLIDWLGDVGGIE